MKEENQDRQLGYLTRALEDNTEVLKNIVARLEKVEAQISLYKFMINTVKVLGASLLFILAFKFGDVKLLWKNYLEG